MAHFSINQYLQQVYDAIQNGDGDMLADLLSCRHAHMASPNLLLEDPDSAVMRVIEPPFDELVAEHLRCVAGVSNHDFIVAYKHQSVLVQNFTKIFQHQKDENWALPVLYTVCLDLRLLALSADVQLTKKGKGKPGETIEKAAENLMGCFRVCAADNRSTTDDSKRWGMLNLVNQLFKIYFKINKLHLCKPLIRAIDSSTYKEQFNISQQVTYRYYVGRKAMFESDFKSAEEYLTFAFERCHKKSIRNKRLILICLIPVKMILGHMPNMQLLAKYDLLQFSSIVKSVVSGNLLQLKEALKEHEAFFIKFGVYLILEKLIMISLRNLFKKICLIQKTHQLPIELFLIGSKMMQLEDVDQDEVNCILANLICEGKIKGYISYQHQKLVISKQNAFPSLSTLN